MTETTLDLRNIGRKPIESTLHVGVTTISIVYSCKLKYNPYDCDSELLGNQDVETFMWESLSRHYDMKESNHYDMSTLYYTFNVYGIQDLDQFKVDFKQRMDFILSCVSWELCPLCGKAKFKFINPDQLDMVWHETEWRCTSGCTDDTRELASKLRHRQNTGQITQAEFELRCIGLELFSKQADYYKTMADYNKTMTLDIPDLVKLYNDRHIGVPGELLEEFGILPTD